MGDLLFRTRMQGRATYTWRLPYGFVVDSGGPEFDLEPPDIRQRWLRGLSSTPHAWVMPKQQHGATVRTRFMVSQLLENHCDGLATDDIGLGLAVFGSDCPGLVLVSPHSFAVAHCGWRGIAAGIVANATNAMTELGAQREQIVAFIGPGICQLCYEVDAEVLSAANWPKGALASSRQVDHWQLDLPRTIAFQLGELGIQQVLHSQVCTSCDPHLHSYRHQGPGVVQVLAVHQE